jgi:hypothetical protein
MQNIHTPSLEKVKIQDFLCDKNGDKVVSSSKIASKYFIQSTGVSHYLNPKLHLTNLNFTLFKAWISSKLLEFHTIFTPNFIQITGVSHCYRLNFSNLLELYTI